MFRKTNYKMELNYKLIITVLLKKIQFFKIIIINVFLIIHHNL